MDHLFTVQRKGGKRNDTFLGLNNHIICSISSSNVIAFTTQTDIDDSTVLTFGSHVYIADLNTSWIVHKILSNACPINVLQWDATSEYLFVADESGCLRIFQMQDHLLNDWVLTLQTVLRGEPILTAVFFHLGKKICLNNEKKDSCSYMEKFQHANKFSSSVKQFGGCPMRGVLLLTSTGMLAVVMIPSGAQSHPQLNIATLITESLAPTRLFIKTADVCYGNNGHFMVAVSNGDLSMPVQCYKVSVLKSDERCSIVSEALASFFIFEEDKARLIDDQAMDQQPSGQITHLNWVMREDADSLVVAIGSEACSWLQVWELRENALLVHEALAGGATDEKSFNAVMWQHQSSYQHKHKVLSVATNKGSLFNHLSSSYIVAAFSDSSIHCLYRDTLKSICSTTLTIPYEDGYKQTKVAPEVVQIDMSWLGNVLVVIDIDSHLHVLKLPPHIDSSTPLSVPYATTMLEYCLMAGLDWLDLLLVLRPGMIDPLCDRFTESFNRQTPAVQQYFYVQYLCIKASLYRLSVQGQAKANDLSQFLMLHSIATAFKSLLRPSEISSHEKSPADSLTNGIADGQSDVDKVLMHLEAKEFTVEPSTLQSLQQLIQWVSDLALNLLARLSDGRPSSTCKQYELIRDVKALNMLREMLVLIRIWGLLRPACLPVFTRSDANLDVLALVFRLLSRLVQNVSEPDDNLIDECLLLPSQVQIQHVQVQPNRIVLASYQFAQNLPLNLEFLVEPDALGTFEAHQGQTVDAVRHLYLGKTPGSIKQCVRCGNATGTVAATRTAAIRAWDQRWIKSCQCGGLWRINIMT